MNKLKPIFCAAFMFIICAVMCVGCSFNISGSFDGGSFDNGTGNQDVSTSIITLDEAKNIILPALSLSNEFVDSALFEKLGKVEFSNQSSVDMIYDKNSKVEYRKMSNNGIFEYAGGVVVYLTNSKDHYLESQTYEEVKSYFINGNGFTKDVNTGIVYTDEYQAGVDAEIYAINAFLCENAFNSILNKDVEKVTTQDGFSLLLKCSNKGLCQIASGLSDEEFETRWKNHEAELKELCSQKDIEESGALLKLNFNKTGNIVSVNLDFNQLVSGGDRAAQNKMQLSIKITANGITQPDWVTEYLASKN